MQISERLLLPIAGLLLIAIVGCNSPGTPVLSHKLVATAGQTSIPLYPDEHTLIEVSHKSQQGGVTGMVGSVEKTFTAKQIDDQTPVQVLSTDENGAQVQIIDGPLKGQTGFVTKQNVN
jgi:transcription antitermination factor NusG